MLARHREVEVTAITSRAQAGTAVADLFPHLRGESALRFSAPDSERLAGCDILFFATPNGVSMGMARELLDAGVRIIDLAADFRLADAAEWEQWYGCPHACPELLAEAVYGLPERNRASIGNARLVANPGCYPTAVLLGFLPLLAGDVVDLEHLVADAASGVSGAGSAVQTANLFCEAGDSFKAYAASGHRHLPEIRQALHHAAGRPVGLTFVPHLTPMVCGASTPRCMHGWWTSIRLCRPCSSNTTPTSRSLMFCRPTPIRTPAACGARTCAGWRCTRPQDGHTVVVLAVIDNLVKGAAGPGDTEHEYHVRS